MISKIKLDAIKAAPSAVDSFKATIDALVDDQTLSIETGGLVKLQLDNHREILEPAILAGLKDEAAAAPAAAAAAPVEA